MRVIDEWTDRVLDEMDNQELFWSMENLFMVGVTLTCAGLWLTLHLYERKIK